MNRAHLFQFADEPEIRADDFIADVPAGLTSTMALLHVLYEGLKLPGYFGFNWNALSDCLRDFHWLSHRSVVLRHADLPAIPRADLREYLGILAEAVESWRSDEERTLRVIFPASLQWEVASLVEG